MRWWQSAPHTTVPPLCWPFAGCMIAEATSSGGGKWGWGTGAVARVLWRKVLFVSHWPSVESRYQVTRSFLTDPRNPSAGIVCWPLCASLFSVLLRMLMPAIGYVLATTVSAFGSGFAFCFVCYISVGQELDRSHSSTQSMTSGLKYKLDLYKNDEQARKDLQQRCKSRRCDDKSLHAWILFRVLKGEVGKRFAGRAGRGVQWYPLTHGGSHDRPTIRAKLLLTFYGFRSCPSLQGITGAQAGPRGAVPQVRSTVMSMNPCPAGVALSVAGLKEGDAEGGLRTRGAQGSSSGGAMPNPIIKWPKRNTQSDPPLPSLGSVLHVPVIRRLLNPCCSLLHLSI